MKIINRSEVRIDTLPGRRIQSVVGKKAFSESKNMTVGFTRFDESAGDMEPHNHAEETIVIHDCKDGYISWGDSKDTLNNKTYLEKDMILHIPEGEWHFFGFDEGGYVEIIFIYGSVNNIRPENRDNN